MVNHIEKLVEATERLMVSYRYAYNDGPDIGVRGYNMNKKVDGISYQGCQDDIVIIDGIVWLIAGDIYNIQAKERVSRVAIASWLAMTAPDSLRVNLRAQTIVASKIVTVELGTREIVHKYDLENEEGVLELA